MIREIQELLDQYLRWLSEKTKLRQVEDWVEITTPYLDRHNDYIQIYTKRENNRYVLTDDGYTIEDLKLSGCKLDSKKRKDLLQMTLNGFGVQLIGEDLLTYATQDNFSLKKHNLIQAMLAVNDLFYLSVPIVTGIFLEDVIGWLDTYDIRYVQNVKFTGTSGYDHVFDFAIPKSKKAPERILKTINLPDRTHVESLAWAWIDTKGVRPSDSIAYAIMNDSEKPIASPVSDALKNYDIVPVPWSLRDQYRDSLAA